MNVYIHVHVCAQLLCVSDSLRPHGIFQARILEWVAISLSRDSTPSRDRTCFHLLRWQVGILFISKKKWLTGPCYDVGEP